MLVVGSTEEFGLSKANGADLLGRQVRYIEVARLEGDGLGCCRGRIWRRIVGRQERYSRSCWKKGCKLEGEDATAGADLDGTGNSSQNSQN